MNLKKITKEKWVNLYKINDKWVFASRKNLTSENFSTQIKKPDAVIIVPILEDSVVVIEQFREPMQGIEISFPAGLIDDNETVESAVARELKEETGLDFEYIISKSPLLFSSAGLTDESVIIVYVICSGEIVIRNEEEKIYAVEKIISLDIPEYIEQKISEGKFFGAKSYTILQYLSFVLNN